MTYKNQATKVAEAKQIAAILVEIESRLPEEIHSSSLTDIINSIDEAAVRKKRLKDELEATIEETKQQIAALTIFMKRLRSGVKSVFGDDSLEYERVGGKRRSDYKRPSRKESATAA